MSNFILDAKTRADAGKGASRRLRALNEVPAIIYGGSASPITISIPHKDLAKAAADETFFAHILTLRVEGKDEKVVIKDMQRHPSKPIILHADFQRIDDTHFITMHVPLHFLNEETCIGVKQQGGVINHDRTDLVVRCLPQNLPEFIEVDMLSVKLGDVLHISDIKLPTAVTSVDLSHGHDHPVVHVVAPKVSGGDDAAA
jgi:large subunit ribosomal protein L25